MNVATVCHEDIAAQEGGLIPYISHIAYVPPQMIGPSFGPFWSENGCRLPILVSLESGIVFEGTTRVYELIYLLFSIPNEQERTRNIRIHSGIQEIFFIAVLIYEMTDIISERPGLKTDMDSKEATARGLFLESPENGSVIGNRQCYTNYFEQLVNSLIIHYLREGIKF